MSGRHFPESRDEKLSGDVTIRISEEDYQYIRESARERQIGMSTFMRELIALDNKRHAP